MADALCGPSTALQTFQKQTSADRTLQQDRLTARQVPAESFRSVPGSNTGILDAEFEAFRAGHPLQAGYPEPDLFYHGPPATSFQRNIGQQPSPDWASDFQNLHLNEARASPIPQAQFHQHVPLQRTGGWHQDFSCQQNQLSPYQPQQQERPADQNYSGRSYGYTGGLMPQHNTTLSRMAQQKQPERRAEDVYDEAAFERAFDAAREEMQQSEESAHRKDTQADAGLHDAKDQDSQGWLDHNRIGSDVILDEAQKREEEGKEADDGEELARTAGQLLENVKGDQSQKFQESNFLSLMRQLRDKEVRVEGDKLVDVSQPLHPGGEHYPNDGGSGNSSYYSRPDYWPEDVKWLVGAGGVRHRESDHPRA
ncbi:MAG: hypothetical protein ASARMPRED_008617 [Alectoria sarmentosa]|nr:MAG: hypothetical protein ASARMPRED_008617 [Alectoria sarmentosa]